MYLLTRLILKTAIQGRSIVMRKHLYITITERII
uniref:Uncharacterized protein n=1 Tax=Siphoviridae sp. ctv4j104 TaxID=2826510 RepID=A0A8S5M9W1_9CAUD|nr:MAG TPA: hypothetical protein [Siphoviridae sp. ctv4j104]